MVIPNLKGEVEELGGEIWIKFWEGRNYCFGRLLRNEKEENSEANALLVTADTYLIGKGLLENQ